MQLPYTTAQRGRLERQTMQATAMCPWASARVCTVGSSEEAAWHLLLTRCWSAAPWQGAMVGPLGGKHSCTESRGPEGAHPGAHV